MNKIELLIENEGTIYQPMIEDNITWETERSGVPGKLTFNVINDNSSGAVKLNFQEGNHVVLRVDDKEVFYGFVFKKSRDKNQIISVTAYDQLRYLKNKAIYDYEDKKASDLIKMIADDYQLECGNIADTGLTMSKLEDNATLFDIILNALDETLRLKNKLFVLYDDFGKLTLKDKNDMKIDCLINESTATDFKYESSIDDETYNQIVLIYDNEKTKTRDVYMTKDTSNINKWGVLQYFEKINESVNGIAKADAMLSLYNSKRRTLTITGAFGDVRVRAGCSVPVVLKLGDVDANTFLLVEKVKHVFENGSHTMDLTLRGDKFV